MLANRLICSTIYRSTSFSFSFCLSRSLFLAFSLSLLVSHSGLEDELIPPWHMRTLYNVSPERSGGGKRIVTVADGTHNDTWERGGSAYLKALHDFVDEVS